MSKQLWWRIHKGSLVALDDATLVLTSPTQLITNLSHAISLTSLFATTPPNRPAQNTIITRLCTHYRRPFFGESSRMAACATETRTKPSFVTDWFCFVHNQRSTAATLQDHPTLWYQKPRRLYRIMCRCGTSMMGWAMRFSLPLKKVEYQ